MNTSKFKDAFNATLPVAGKSGTLNSLCRNQPGQGRISAKSGTMSKIKSYSGYVQSSSGKKIAFAIILTNFSGSSSNATTKIESILNQLANF
jgi:D-alanyl-D-alanine carboxypeptidase/D-alanyl-D-alanine-endopeptidase (penicillin-binding protein 4)